MTPDCEALARLIDPRAFDVINGGLREIMRRDQTLYAAARIIAAGWAPVVVPETLSEAQQTPLSPVDAQQASLTWTDHRPPDATIPYDHVIAETPLGSIWIEWKSWKESPSYTSDMPWTHFIVESSLSDAKVKVQELWDRKISELVGADIASQRVEAPQLDIAAIQGEAFERAKKDVMKLYGAATYEDGMQLKRAAEAMAVSPGSRVVVIPADVEHILTLALAGEREPGRGPADKTKSRHRREHAFAALMVEADAQRARIAEMEAALLRLSEVTPERLNVSSAVVALNAVRAIAATALNPGDQK